MIDKYFNKAEEYLPHYSIIALFALFNVLIPFTFWSSEFDEIILRFIATGMCFCMFFINNLLKVKYFNLSLFWFTSIIYLFSFIPFLLLFGNDFTSFWVANLTISLITLSFFVNRKTYFTINFVILTGSYIYFKGFSKDLYLSENLSLNQLLYLVSLISIVANVIMLFSKKLLLAISEKNIELEKNQKNLEKGFLRISSENKELGGRAESASNIKNEILASVGHEIRTPLHSIKQMSSLIEDWKRLDAKQFNNIVDVLNKSISRLEEFTSDLLEITKIKDHDILTPLGEKDIKKLFKEIIEEAKFDAQEKNLHLNFSSKTEKNSDNVTFLLDIIRIKQLIRNLISNAIKFTEEGQIDVFLNLTSESISIIVSDSGPGIKEEDIEKIWQPFSRSKTENFVKGTGLGLAICKGIVEFHHGKIWAENNKNSDGASFHIILPQIIPKQTETVNQLKQNPQNITIMIVDDEELIMSSLEILLKSLNFNVLCFTNPIKALKHLKNNPNNISLILLDLMMPEMHGSNFVMEVMQDESLSYIPIIIQSGLVDKLEVQKLKKLGIKDYLTKPYSKETLLESINNHAIEQKIT